MEEIRQEQKERVILIAVAERQEEAEESLTYWRNWRRPPARKLRQG